jgi:hypothetical protein
MKNELIPLAENPVAKVNLNGVGRDGKTQDTRSPPCGCEKQSSTNCNWQRERLSWLPYSRFFVPVKSSISGKPWIS